MNILLISNNIDLVKNIKTSYPDSSIKVIVNSYETKESATFKPLRACNTYKGYQRNTSCY